MITRAQSAGSTSSTGTAVADSGVRPHDVQPAVPVEDLRDRLLAAVLVGDVEHDEIGARDRGRGLLQGRLVHVGQDDGRAASGELGASTPRRCLGRPR